ncbi:DNA-binding response regulator [Clostridium sp. chh4-2]|uniref:LytR/AlgR family response regulator transcription factor n=1 Tax=Clostridium sp. chh4-2 TaxID=2067550 RepID=UPI000CCDFDA1|nr:LytTR family DNA-binding domain-containing protein [Clostridium sp. chh4-2]PNV61210.1 DNA-binding response regulator [Clostridium sp. chh4-2]
MNIRIAVCEDCQTDAELLCGQITRYCCENGLPPYVIDVYESGDAFSKHCIPGSYDLVFMDIYLENEDGMQMVRELRKKDKECPVVFFTRSMDHAVEAFEVNAAHYLTKPLVYDKLAEALKRCQKIHEKQSKFILLPAEGSLRKIRIAEIVFVEVFDNTSVIHLENENIPARIPLKSLEEEIKRADQQADFLRCHRSYLVNMNWIMALRNDFFLMDTGIPIPISKYTRRQTVRSYEEFALRRMQDAHAVQPAPGGKS